MAARPVMHCGSFTLLITPASSQAMRVMQSGIMQQQQQVVTLATPFFRNSSTVMRRWPCGGHVAVVGGERREAKRRFITSHHRETMEEFRNAAFIDEFSHKKQNKTKILRTKGLKTQEDIKKDEKIPH